MTYSIADDGSKLVFEFRNTIPMELTDITKSLLAVSSQYKRFVSRNDLEQDTSVKLYVKEIKNGSVIVELFSYVQANQDQIVHLIKISRSVIDFCFFLKNSFVGLESGKAAVVVDLNKKDLDDLTNILEPTSKDPGGYLNIHADNGATVNVTINITNKDANTIQNQSHKLIEMMKEQEQKNFYRRLFYWHSASKGKSSKTDKGVIESIEDKPVPVVFEDNEIKQRMLEGKENPFFTAYIVDVELLIIKGKIKAYKITALYDTIENEDEPVG